MASQSTLQGRPKTSTCECVLLSWFGGRVGDALLSEDFRIPRPVGLSEI